VLGVDTSYDDKWMKGIATLAGMPTIRCRGIDDQRDAALEVKAADGWPQTQQARPSMKVARIDEPERAWCGFHPIDRADACRNLRRSGSAGHGTEKPAPLVREIGWSHNLVILERCKDASSTCA
jgi:hypothetical protein